MCATLVAALAAWTVLLAPMLLWGIVVAWMGPTRHETMDPIGNWDDVLADTAVTTLQGVKVELSRARQNMRNAKARLRRALNAGNADRAHAAHLQIQAIGPMVLGWAAIAAEWGQA